jgi:hypothetical protein
LSSWHARVRKKGMANTIVPKKAEIKVTLAGKEAVKKARELLDLDSRIKEACTIYFFDKAERAGEAIRFLLLDRVGEGGKKEGIIIRARRYGNSGDLTLKLRPCNTERLVDPWRVKGEGDNWKYRIEKDWVVDGEQVDAASLEVENLDPHDIDDIVEASEKVQTPDKLLIKKQKELLESYAPDIALTEPLMVLGPIKAIKWEDVEGHGLSLNIEQWQVGDELCFVELSLRVELAQAPEAEHKLKDLLAALDLGYDSRRQNKTRRVMTRLAEDYLTHPRGM